MAAPLNPEPENPEKENANTPRETNHERDARLAYERLTPKQHADLESVVVTESYRWMFERKPEIRADTLRRLKLHELENPDVRQRYVRDTSVPKNGDGSVDVFPGGKPPSTRRAGSNRQPR